MSTAHKEEDRLARAREQGAAQLESIREMVKALETAEEADDDRAREDAIQAIQEDPLSVEVRSDWRVPGGESEDTEYRILLATGGPAAQIVGELGEYNEPRTAQLQVQDWFTPWTDLELGSGEREALLTYARQFYYGDG
jgi:hypothetical protein